SGMLFAPTATLSRQLITSSASKAPSPARRRRRRCCSRVTPVAAGCPRSGRTVPLRLTFLSLAQARFAVLRLGPPKLERQRFVEWPVSQCAAQPSAENRRISFRPLNRAQKV